MSTRSELEAAVRTAVAKFAPFEGLSDVLSKKDLVRGAKLEAEVKAARASLAEYDAQIEQNLRQAAREAAQRQAAREAERARKIEDRADEHDLSQLTGLGPAELQQLERALSDE
jgi:predicted flap endonuclease-1-like 5' DNA nuclease